MMIDRKQDADVIIIGGGLVGRYAAVSLAQQQFSVIVIDPQPICDTLDTSFDGRTTSVALASAQKFDRLKMWDDLSQHASPIQVIKVFEGDTPWSLQFDHKAVGPEPMGYIIGNPWLKHVLAKHVLKTPNIQWIGNDEVLSTQAHTSHITAQLKSGKTLTASLVLGAEGRHSPSRERAGISYKTFDYDQKAIVCTVAHTQPHQGIAWEAFYPEGPLAFLPLLATPEHPHMSGMVWTLPTQSADTWFAQSDEALIDGVSQKFNFLGPMQIVGQRWIYPLKALMTKRMIDQRFALVGDAAHAYHPVAGQGVNVGWRDIDTLVELAMSYRHSGLDIGSTTLLRTYQRRRLIDQWSVFGATDGMVRLFSNHSKVLKALRMTGLGIVNRMSLSKRFFMRRAMGYT